MTEEYINLGIEQLDNDDAERALHYFQAAYDLQPDNAEDRRLAELIKRDALAKGQQDIDDMVEFDIRKDFLHRSWFWLWHRQQHDISLKRYLRCVLKTVKYRL